MELQVATHQSCQSQYLVGTYLYGLDNRTIYYFFYPQTIYRTRFGPTQIEYPLVPLISLSYHSETVHIPLSLPKISALQLPPLAYPQNTLLLVNAPLPRHWQGYSVYFPPSLGSLSVPQSKLISDYEYMLSIVQGIQFFPAREFYNDNPQASHTSL